jgi:hypothetical protein
MHGAAFAMHDEGVHGANWHSVGVLGESVHGMVTDGVDARSVVLDNGSVHNVGVRGMGVHVLSGSGRTESDRAAVPLNIVFPLQELHNSIIKTKS